MEITINNFEEKFNEIKDSIEKSCFIGYDAEFTGLLLTHRLFNTNEERYNLIQNKNNKTIISQLGLTMFTYDRDRDSYSANCYNFYLCPQSFADIHQDFMFQASSVKFLRKFNFDFNKFLYDGIPYLSKTEEKQIRQSMKDDTILTNIMSSLSISEEKLLQKHCSDVAFWLSQSEGGTMYIDLQEPVLRFALHKQLRMRFPNIFTTNSLGESNKILLYRNKDIEGATSAPNNVLEENFMDSILGFSKVISLLEKHRKPILGHNLYFDLILLHNQFIGPLPSKYGDFRKNLNESFPFVYDTKYISHSMGKSLSLDEVWSSNSLQDLYEFFYKGKYKKLGFFTNSIIETISKMERADNYHEAGWDSYASGYCFIQLAHWAALENSKKARVVSPTEILAVLEKYSNKINIIYGAMPYMNLCGDDPPSHRPTLVYVQSLKEKRINVAKVASLLSACGAFDVKPYGSKGALVAANSQATADRIFKKFKDSHEYKFSKYSAHRYSLTGRMALWGGAMITGSLMLYLLHKNVKY